MVHVQWYEISSSTPQLFVRIGCEAFLGGGGGGLFRVCVLLERLLQPKGQTVQHPLALLLVGGQRALVADPGPLEGRLGGGLLAVLAGLLGGEALGALLVGAGFAVCAGVALVLAEQPEEPRPLLERVAAGLVLAEVLGDGLDLGDEEQLELLARGQLVEGVGGAGADAGGGGDGGGLAELGGDAAEVCVAGGAAAAPAEGVRRGVGVVGVVGVARLGGVAAAAAPAGEAAALDAQAAGLLVAVELLEVVALHLGNDLVAGEDGDGAELDGDVLDKLDDGVLGVGDEDGHGGQGEEGPEDEEGLAGVGLGDAVAVADGGEGDEAEVKGVKVGPPGLVVALGEPEDEGAEQPEDDEGADGRGQVGPAAAGHGAVLDVAHELKLDAAALKLVGDVRAEGLVLGGHGAEDGVVAGAGELADEAAARLFLEADADAAAGAVENHAADGADDETEGDDADESERQDEGAGEGLRGGKVAEADGEEGDVGPVDAVEVVPALDLAEDEGAEEHVGEEGNGLQHEGALAVGEGEALAEVAGGGAPKGGGHEGGDDKVEDGGPDAVVEGLREDVFVVGVRPALFEGAGCCGA